MQEHIRRAHPSHYIPKLPATEESFQLMVNTPLDQRTHLPQSNATHPRRGPSLRPFDGRKFGTGANRFPADAGERDIFGHDGSSPVTLARSTKHILQPPPPPWPWPSSTTIG